LNTRWNALCCSSCSDNHWYQKNSSEAELSISIKIRDSKSYSI